MGIALVPSAGSPMPDDLAQQVAQAQEELARAAAAGVMRRDPYRLVLGALATMAGVFPTMVARIEAATESTRTPLSPEERAALRRDVRDGLRQEAARLVLAINRGVALVVGGAIVLAALGAAGGGYLLGRASVREDMVALESRLTLDPGASRAWLGLMRANGDPRPALAAATTWSDPSGRKAGELRLWLEPPPSAPPRR